MWLKTSDTWLTTSDKGLNKFFFSYLCDQDTAYRLRVEQSHKVWV